MPRNVIDFEFFIVVTASIFVASGALATCLRKRGRECESSHAFAAYG